MAAAVVELDALPDAVGAAAEDEHWMGVVFGREEREKERGKSERTKRYD